MTTSCCLSKPRCQNLNESILRALHTSASGKQGPPLDVHIIESDESLEAYITIDAGLHAGAVVSKGGGGMLKLPSYRLLASRFPR